MRYTDGEEPAERKVVEEREQEGRSDCRSKVLENEYVGSQAQAEEWPLIRTELLGKQEGRWSLSTRGTK